VARLRRYASGTAVARAAEAVCGTPISAEDVFRLGTAGNAALMQVIDSAATMLAIGCLNLVCADDNARVRICVLLRRLRNPPLPTLNRCENLLCRVNAQIRAVDPDVIVLAGGVAAAMLPHVRRHLRRLTWRLHDDAALVPLSLASCPEPGVQGACALGLQQLMPTSAAPTSVVLDRATPSDLTGLYQVCLGTGDSGADGSHLFSDPALLGTIYVGPYVTLSPHFAFALRHPSGQCCGYVLGVLDTVRFVEQCRQDWWPAVRERYPLADLGRYRANEQALLREHVHNDQKAVSPLSAEHLARYPSHMHIDLLAPVQGHGWGPVMVTRLLDALRGAGSIGVHLTMSAQNHRAFRFYGKLGFVPLIHGPEFEEWTLGLAL
jgi:GNAT superfamily N-acetyltransferase